MHPGPLNEGEFPLRCTLNVDREVAGQTTSDEVHYFSLPRLQLPFDAKRMARGVRIGRVARSDTSNC